MNLNLKGIAIFAASAIGEIPVCVLFGIFIYFGFMTLNSTQLVDRVKLMCLYSTKAFPRKPYSRQVCKFKRNLFTIIQLSFVVAILALKVTRFALLFPLVLILSVPARLYCLSRFMTDQELKALDSGDDGSQTIDSEDLYAQVYFPI
ncbi:hypothetical protein ACOME3_007230 [Neoechinorhynchus agilis]